MPHSHFPLGQISKLFCYICLPKLSSSIFFFNFYFLERTVWNRQNQSFIGQRVCPSLVMLNYLNNILPSEKVLSYIHLELRLTLLFTLLFISSSGREKKEKKEKRALRIKCNTPPNTHSIPHKDKTIK